MSVSPLDATPTRSGIALLREKIEKHRVDYLEAYGAGAAVQMLPLKPTAEREPAGWDDFRDLKALKRAVLNELDAEWVARYGQAAWQAALAVLGEHPDDEDEERPT